MTVAACAFCGKSVVKVPLGFAADVRKGAKLFHLDCYRLHKRQASPKIMNRSN
jgi:hypothetical protein